MRSNLKAVHGLNYFWLLGFALALAFVLPGCKSTDPLTEQNLHRAWDVREQDKRPVVSDEELEAMSDEQKALHLPESLDKARAFERDQAYRYEESKK